MIGKKIKVETFLKINVATDDITRKISSNIIIILLFDEKAFFKSLICSNPKWKNMPNKRYFSQTNLSISPIDNIY